MRKIINSTYVSLDGVVERPHEWSSVGGRGSKGDEIQTELLLSCDALLMGRRTYEGFAPVWPTRSGDPASDHINALFVGKADPSELLYRHCPSAIFALTDATTLENGVVILSYRYPRSG
jgi:dihydrofolate reductase